MRWLLRPDHPDASARIANAIALLVAASQPFYPLYLHSVAGAAAWPAWLVLATTPAYATIPMFSRRHGRLARAMLPIVGVVNTLIAVKALGPASGVELFYLPCILAATALTKPGATWLAVLLVAMVAFAYLVAGGWLGPPLAAIPPDDLSAMVRLHAVSAAGLIAFSGFQLRSAMQ